MLTGQLTARNAAFQTVFSIAFNGAGTAAITLHQETPGAWHAHAVAYNFDLSRTPEPATVVLLGSGVAILIGRTLRRKNK
jgi:hypothetical protein